MNSLHSTPDVVLVDSGGSNIVSVQSAFLRLGVQTEVSCAAERIRRASHVVLPGVGAAAPGMARLRKTGLDQVLPGLTQPVLGICLGMQLLFESSEESDTPCLNLFPGRARRFEEPQSGRVPHMGWNRLRVTRSSPLLDRLPEMAYAYFVHSYALPTSVFTMASCDYGIEFSALVSRQNFHGVQFHPERSSIVGELILSNFLRLAA